MKAVLLTVLTAAPLFTQPIHVKLDPDRTTILFTLPDVLHTVHGTFKLTEGDVWIDPATGRAGGRVVVNAARGDSGSHARDSRMEKNILQAQLFPQITFSPDRLEGTVAAAGDSSFQLLGDFAIHGLSHRLALAVKSHIDGGRVTATASLEVPYVSWGMKDPSTLFLRVSDTVQIQISAVGRTD